MAKTETNLEPGEMAVSAFRAFCFAGGIEEEPNWNAVSDEQQNAWYVLAIKAERALEALEGQEFPAVARRIAAIWSGKEDYYDRLSGRLQWCWQAVARHLNALLDSDEIAGNLDALERSWGPWANRKVHA